MTFTSRGGHRKSIQLIKAHPLHVSGSVGDDDDLEQIEERLREIRGAGGSVQNERAGSID
jgi:hypothetical protein